METLDIISMGFKIRDFQNNEIKDFTNIDQELVKKLRVSITKPVIKNFLQSKTVYQLTTTPIKRQSFNWTVVQDKNIKWQMDTVYLGDYLQKELGWSKKTDFKNQSKVIPDSHGIV